MSFLPLDCVSFGKDSGENFIVLLRSHDYLKLRSGCWNYVSGHYSWLWFTNDEWVALCFCLAGFKASIWSE